MKEYLFYAGLNESDNHSTGIHIFLSNNSQVVDDGL